VIAWISRVLGFEASGALKWHSSEMLLRRGKEIVNKVAELFSFFYWTFIDSSCLLTNNQQ
jgi:hypothetical protein